MRIKRPVIVLVTCIATLVAGLLVLNFSPGEKKIDTQLTRQYDTDDPQFRRSLGVLLGPPIVEGNQAAALLNCDQIFPAMLAAIRSAQKSVMMRMRGIFNFSLSFDIPRNFSFIAETLPGLQYMTSRIKNMGRSCS